MSQRKQNWNERFFKVFGPRFRIDVANPVMGLGGSDVFRMYGATKQGNKFSLGMNESGRVEMNSDVSIDIIAGQKNDAKSTDIFIHSRSGTIDINVAQNGKVRVRGNNVEIDASESITMNARSIRLEGSDEISLQAPKVWSRGRKGNLVPKTFMQSVAFGSFIGADSIGGFLEKGLQEAAGIVDNLDDLTPELDSLAGKAGDLAKNLGDQLPSMQDQLKNIGEDFAKQAEQFASSDAVANLGESLQGSVSNIQSALQANSGAFANLGKGLQQIKPPSGY
jgi:hypothetical protein